MVQAKILKLAMFFMSIKFLYNFFISIFIKEKEGEDCLTLHMHLAFLIESIYSAKSQSSWHTVLFFSIKSFLLSFNDISVPYSDFVV